IIVETPTQAPAESLAVAELDYVSIYASSWRKEDVPEALFVSLVNTNYSVIYVDEMLSKQLTPYVNEYASLILTADPPVLPQDLIPWVVANRSLTILNFRGFGSFSKLLELNQSSSELIHVKKIGSGTVVYVNVYSLENSGRLEQIYRTDFLDLVKRASGARYLPNESRKVGVTLPYYNSTSGSKYVKGSLSISTDFLDIEGSIDCTDLNVSPDKMTKIQVFGRSVLSLDNNTFTILPFESLTEIRCEGQQLSGNLLVENESVVTVNGAPHIFGIYKTQESIKLRGKEFSIKARLPTINSTGEVIFDSLYVHIAPYTPLADTRMEKERHNGSVSFNSMFISSSVILFSRFWTNGSISPFFVSAKGISIPWVATLFSPYNLILTVTVSLLFLQYITTKNRLIWAGLLRKVRYMRVKVGRLIPGREGTEH
ncbi:hypothetical protein MUP77_12640, partial [Candidatus Bathyarchaeota archaeon]|nr:hypothetical protein [Candidatus Bathyarchaeota archaeon]